MSYATATFPGVVAYNRRGIGRTDARRAVCGSIAIGVGTVTAAGLMAGCATVAAAWLVTQSLGSNSRLHSTSPFALETSALNQPYRDLLRAAGDFSPPPVIAVPAAPPRPVRDAEITPPAARAPSPAIPQHAPNRAAPARVASVPLPEPRPRLALRVPPAAPALPVEAKHRPSLNQPRVAVATPPEATSDTNLAPQRPVAALPEQARTEPLGLPAPGSHTAVYDIAGHTVFLPDGERLEAHSGLGRLLDDPRYVSARGRGPTPPNVYDLTLREEIFHGVKAIRLNPVSGSHMFGRDGILAHTYMLGPSGQSFGCVSFRNYPAFLHAYLNGEINRLVVVPHVETDVPIADRSRRRPGDHYAFNNR